MNTNAWLTYSPRAGPNDMYFTVLSVRMQSVVRKTQPLDVYRLDLRNSRTTVDHPQWLEVSSVRDWIRLYFHCQSVM